MNDAATADRTIRELERSREELVDFAADLVRIPTVNPPGDAYPECARLIGKRLSAWGMDVAYLEPSDRPEHTAAHPRLNVLGRREGGSTRPCIHLNGHFDVVPPGQGWTVDPFGGVVKDGRLFGRGASDMKSGLAAAAFAVEALRRVGAELSGTVEVSGTVDEESGGFAGVASLCEMGLISGSRTDHVIIPEPFGPDRICLGHKGVYWFDVVAEGKAAHGSMPHLGRSAIDDMAALIEAFRSELGPSLEERVSRMPVVPRQSATPSINVNAVAGGQVGDGGQTPCVADECVATFDRRFVPEETLEDVRAEVERLVRTVESRDPGRSYRVEERLVVLPTRTPPEAPLVRALVASAERVRGKEPELVASPGTYDQKHVMRIGGVDECVAYGPGPLKEAHQADESCSVDDILASAQVIALTVLDLVG